ncbi:MAG: hypothetical protein WBA74_22610, partial [Cyclobacteriaceae bacterium]
TDKAETWFSDNTGAKLQIGNIYLNWANELEIDKAYLEDQAGDTLAYIGNLSTSVSLIALTKQTLDLTAIELKNTTINLEQTGKEETFNFQFILDSLASGQPQADTVTTDTATSAPWEIIIEEIDLENIGFSLRNTHAKTDLEVKLQSVNTTIDRLGLDSMTFALNTFEITGADIYYRDDSDPAPPPTTTKDTAATPPFSLTVKTISITESEVDFISKTVIYGGELTDFSSSDVSFNLQQQTMGAELISLKNSKNIVELFPTDSVVTTSEPTALPFDITIGKIEIADNRFSLLNQQPPTPEFNPEQLRLTEINAEITDVRLNDRLYKGKINQISLIESEKIAINTFTTDFQYLDSIVTIDGLKLITNHSNLSVTAKYDLKTDYSGTNRFRVSQLDGVIAKEDIAYFYPPIDTFPIREKISFSGRARGDFDEVAIESFMLKTGATVLNATGNIANLTSETAPLRFDIPKLKLQSTARHINSIVPDTLLPENITIPDTIDLTAAISGNLNDITGKIDLTTTLGDISTDLAYTANAETGAVSFKMNPDVDSVRLGEILGMEVLGPLTMKGKISGSGPSFAESEINADVTIDYFTYNEFTYEKIKIDGVAQGASFDGKIKSETEELDFLYEGMVSFNDSLNAADFKLDINNIDLQALNFTNFPMQIETVITADIDYNANGRLNGDIAVRKVEIDRKDAVYYVDSLVFISIDNDQKTDLTLDSDLFNGYLKGNMPLKEIPQELTEHFSRYFDENSDTTAIDILDKKFEFYLNIKRPELISQAIVPGLEKLKISPLEITFN